MSILIKSSHLTRDEIHRKAQVGFAPEYQHNPEGVGIDRARYAKNYQLALGKCKNCPNFIKSKADTTTGEHCKLRFCNVR